MAQIKTEKTVHFIFKSEQFHDLPQVDELITIKRMTVADSMKISALKTRLLGGLPALTAADDIMAEKFSTIQVLVKSENLKLDSIFDETMIDALYLEVKAFNDSFRGRIGTANRDHKRDSEGESQV